MVIEVVRGWMVISRSSCRGSVVVIVLFWILYPEKGSLVLSFRDGMTGRSEIIRARWPGEVIYVNKLILTSNRLPTKRKKNKNQRHMKNGSRVVGPRRPPPPSEGVYY